MISKRTPMFDPKGHLKHFGPELKLSEKYDVLADVEEYFIRECSKHEIEWSHDVTAEEPPYFKTLNYTSYAGLFIIHPLQTELSLRQMYGALMDAPEEVNFIGFLKNAIETKTVNKYNTERVTVDRNSEAVVVLPGSNKLKTHICLNKIRWIYEKHGKNVIYKPHPITHLDAIKDFCRVTGIPKSSIASPKEDLYKILTEVDFVYTTHISESASYAAILGKKLSPIDPVQTRSLSSFSHLNYFFFTEPNPETWVNKMFSSYRSGVIHPNIDKNWRQKIDFYFDYILSLRDRYKDSYIYSR